MRSGGGQAVAWALELLTVLANRDGAGRLLTGFDFLLIMAFRKTVGTSGWVGAFPKDQRSPARGGPFTR
ncbi:hypothetical protein A4R35_06280 [Thermogemmatispora tikiterensis]|uniref:Uncharacterized protein n=1 Tax=Thermogemmatispora tikiterensis TaxID=1825093 RepID=A0A328VLV0_9CHLR|nr:hypothetical protein A4R35_06280 [Thermogemmatispora tikiterensis]